MNENVQTRSTVEILDLYEWGLYYLVVNIYVRLEQVVEGVL